MAVTWENNVGYTLYVDGSQIATGAAGASDYSGGINSGNLGLYGDHLEVQKGQCLWTDLLYHNYIDVRSFSVAVKLLEPARIPLLIRRVKWVHKTFEEACRIAGFSVYAVRVTLH